MRCGSIWLNEVGGTEEVGRKVGEAEQSRGSKASGAAGINR